jgi:hypothetical protein
LTHGGLKLDGVFSLPTEKKRSDWLGLLFMSICGRDIFPMQVGSMRLGPTVKATIWAIWIRIG